MKSRVYLREQALARKARKMDGFPLVSVGVPVYNGEDDLPQAVESLLAQSYSNLEIIISDNASTDRTQQVSLELAARDRRVRYRRLDRNIGANGNFDSVKDLATGEYFMWTGADDIRPPDSIKLLLEALMKNPRAVMAHGPIITKLGEVEQLIPNKMDLLGPHSSQRVQTLTRGMHHIAMEYGLYRLVKLREAVYKYQHNCFYGGDYLICLQMCFLGPIEYVPSPMIVYRIRTMSPASPMGNDTPLTARNLLFGTKRMWKTWSVLIRGSYYLLRLRQFSFWQRVAGVLTHVSAFVVRHKRRLATDFLLIATSTLAAFPLAIWKYVRSLPLLGHLDSRLKNFFQRS